MLQKKQEDLMELASGFLLIPVTIGGGPNLKLECQISATALKGVPLFQRLTS